MIAPSAGPDHGAVQIDDELMDEPAGPHRVVVAVLIDSEAEQAAGPPGISADQVFHRPFGSFGETTGDAEVQRADRVGISEGSGFERTVPQHDLRTASTMTNLGIEALPSHRCGDPLDGAPC
jgi:hypothetical protein